MKANFLSRVFRPKIECPHWDVLHPIRILKTLTRRELGAIELILHERSYLDGEIVFEEGEPGLGMYIILDGGVRIVRRTAARVQAGHEVLIHLGPGESFGEMALLDGVRRSAAAVATGPTRILSLFQTEFLRLLQNNPQIGFKVSYEMARILAERLRGAVERDPTSEPV